VLLDGEIGGRPPGLWITDLLHLDGRDCMPLPYAERRGLLDSLSLTGPHWRPAPSYSGGGAAVVEAAAEQGLPSVIAKRAGSAYRPGDAGDDWREIPTTSVTSVIPDSSGTSASAPPTATRGASTPVTAAGRTVRLTNPDKVLYPRASFRKKDVLDHYLVVAEAMLPHLAGRPVTLRRWPDGVESTPFFEKNVSRHVPDWVRTVRLASPGSSRGTEAIDYPLIDDAAGLAWVANLAALELHVPQWTVDAHGARRPPDLLVFDLDPGEGATIVDCARVALRLAEVLEGDGLTAHPRTSGGKGMQLYAAVNVADAERTSAYAKLLAEQLTAEDPARVTAVMARQRRREKVFIDWSQNNPAKTTVASYSLRGREQPTVATPLTWEEVRSCRRPEDLMFTAHDLPRRLADHGDLMAPLLDGGDALPERAPSAAR
jgi:bifunctional non-homologous end joining protein LigD